MKTAEQIKVGIWCCIKGACTKASCPYSWEGKMCSSMLRDDAIGLIQQLEAQVPRWISVEERLPEAKLAVLVLAYDNMYDNGVLKPCPSVHVGYTRGEDEGWFDWHCKRWLDVTHWMPMDVLPEPPKEEHP